MAADPAAGVAPQRDDLAPDWLERGLSAPEVAARAAVAAPEPPAGQTFGQILRRNALNRLNFLLLALGTATLATGSAPDATFLIIAVVNTVVGASEEVRAKRKLEALAVLSAPHARVIRDGREQEVSREDVVMDDLLYLKVGDQLTADAVVVADRAEVDESLVTGESEPLAKTVGDRLTSGSWVVTGAVLARVTGTGPSAYANRLAVQARRYSLTSSELVSGNNLILRWLTVIMAVIAPVLIFRQLQSEPWRIAVRGAVAGLVGMIPEGLVLLTTLAFLAAAVRLGRRRVLVQELPAVETLARVDALCTDKTGTLTTGGTALAGLEAEPSQREEVEAALAAMAAERDANATIKAAAAGVGTPGGWVATDHVPFSSARKWSATSFAGHGTWVVGAPEVLAGDGASGLLSDAAAAAAAGARVIVVARSRDGLRGERLPPNLTVVGVVQLRESVRPAVRNTLRYFADQGVTVRVISGDSAATVSALAEKVGLPGAERAVDARSLRAGEGDFAARVEEGRVFGRVTPEQKQAMVAALHESDHTVAMTGDGVNDVLALKASDLGIAMGSGSAVTRGVAQLVMVDDDFDVLPSVVAEGRRVLGNIEMVAGLFLVKNVYSLLISVATSVTGWPYPYLPRHMTLISGVGIGIPGFFLALAPNARRFVPGFVRRVLSFAVPAGTLTAVAVLTVYAAARAEGLSGNSARTAAIIVTVVVTLWVLAIAARPLTPRRAALVLAMAGLFAGAYLVPGVDTFFSLEHRLPLEILLQALGFGAAAAVGVELVCRLPFIRRLAASPPGHRPRGPQGDPGSRSDEEPPPPRLPV